MGSSSARAVDFSIFSVVLCTPQEIFKRLGEYPHEIAGPRDFESEGNTPQLAPSAQLRGKLLYNVSLRASESSECFGDSEGARLGN